MNKHILIEFNLIKEFWSKNVLSTRHVVLFDESDFIQQTNGTILLNKSLIKATSEVRKLIMLIGRARTYNSPKREFSSKL